MLNGQDKGFGKFAQPLVSKTRQFRKLTANGLMLGGFLVRIAVKTDQYFIRQFDKVRPETLGKLANLHNYLRTTDIEWAANIKMCLGNKEIGSFPSISVSILHKEGSTCAKNNLD